MLSTNHKPHSGLYMYEDMERVQKSLKIFFHPIHQQMMDNILRHENKAYVGQLYKGVEYSWNGEVVHIEQSIMSQRLSQLSSVGLVTSKREGKKIYYSVDKEKREKFFSVTNTCLECLNETNDN